MSRERALIAGALLFWVWVAAALAVPALVAQVIDGDTIVLTEGRHVRLIGVNAPELGRDGTPDRPLARAARARLLELLRDRRVELMLDDERRDHYGRWLAHLARPDGRSVQEILLREGFAFAIAAPPNLKKLDSYLAAEREARAARRGVWGHPAYAPISAERLALADTGFRLVEGRVQRLGHGRHAVYLDLAPQFSLVVPQEARRYFDFDPQRLVGHRVVAQGWVSAHDGKLRMRLPHPAMVTLLD